MTGMDDLKKIRAADAKEVGMGNPAEETYCHPNPKSKVFIQISVTKSKRVFKH
jgi:hypothetical protein